MWEKYLCAKERLKGEIWMKVRQYKRKVGGGKRERERERERMKTTGENHGVFLLHDSQ